MLHAFNSAANFFLFILSSSKQLRQHPALIRPLFCRCSLTRIPTRTLTGILIGKSDPISVQMAANHHQCICVLMEVTMRAVRKHAASDSSVGIGTPALAMNPVMHLVMYLVIFHF